MPRYNPILEQLPTYPQQALEQRKADILSAGTTLLDFGVGDPKEPVIDAIRNRLANSIPANCRYPKVLGSEEIRLTIARYISRRFGVELSANEHILPLSGAKEAVFHLPQLVIDPSANDNVILLPDPGYPAYYRGGLFAGGEPIPVPLSGDYIFRPWELDESLLKRCRLLWINSPHNPSGSVMTLAELQRTAELCRAYDILLVSDECYADIYSSEAPHSILECGLENVLSIHSLSKRSGMTGYRSGFIAGDPDVIERFRRYRANPGVVPQSFVNEAAIVAWSDDEHVEKRRSIFRDRKEMFIQFFDEMGWPIIGRTASLYLWTKVPENTTANEWAHLLLEEGIVVSPGTMFSITNAGDKYLRIAIVPSTEECLQAIQIWKRLIGEYNERKN
jgi:LL-diaminopimelate aminotransferase